MNNYTINFRQGSKVMEIGGGNNPIVHPNMDVRAGDNIDIVHDLSKFPWPIDDNSYDGIFSKYCLEHLSWRDIKQAIDELYRILRPGGKGVFFLPNTLEQCKKVVDEGINEGSIEMLFGSQEFDPRHIGAHKTGFSPEYAKKLFKEAGFGQITIFEHPNTITDMIIEVDKMNEEDVFEREYFEEGTIGYKQYRDFPQHYTTARKIMEMLFPKGGPSRDPSTIKVLELGAARGYVTRILENKGIKAVAMDISKYCYHTRATTNFILHDIIDVPWHKARVFGDKEFNITFSINVLEHIPEEQIDKVITEMARVSEAGLHGIHYTDAPYKESPDIDVTHRTMHPKSWWQEKFREIAPDYNALIMYPRELENDDDVKCIAYPPKSPDNLVKLNIGSFMDMFYYGWTNIDIIDLRQFAESYGYIFKVMDVTNRLYHSDGRSYEDNSVDLIFSSHLLEHLSREEGAKFLKECHRVLKKDGVIRISTPDAERLSSEYINGQIWMYKYINVGVEQAKDSAEAYYNLLLAGHKTIYDKKALDNMLKEAGFNLLPSITPFTSNSDTIQKQTITNFPTLSTIVEAKKIVVKEGD